MTRSATPSANTRQRVVRSTAKPTIAQGKLDLAAANRKPASQPDPTPAKRKAAGQLSPPASKHRKPASGPAPTTAKPKSVRQPAPAAAKPKANAKRKPASQPAPAARQPTPTAAKRKPASQPAPAARQPTPTAAKTAVAKRVDAAKSTAAARRVATTTPLQKVPARAPNSGDTAARFAKRAAAAEAANVTAMEAGRAASAASKAAEDAAAAEAAAAAARAAEDAAAAEAAAKAAQAAEDVAAAEAAAKAAQAAEDAAAAEAAVKAAQAAEDAAAAEAAVKAAQAAQAAKQQLAEAVAAAKAAQAAEAAAAQVSDGDEYSPEDGDSESEEEEEEEEEEADEEGEDEAMENTTEKADGNALEKKDAHMGSQRGRFKAWIANLLRPYGATGASKEVIKAAFLQYSMPPRKKKNGGEPRARGPAVMMQMLEHKLLIEMKQSRVYCANDKFILRCKKSAKDTVPRRSNTKNVLDILLTFGENGASKREIVTVLRTKYGSLYEHLDSQGRTCVVKTVLRATVFNDIVKVRVSEQGEKRYVLTELPASKDTLSFRVVEALSSPEVGANGMDVQLLAETIYSKYKARYRYPSVADYDARDVQRQAKLTAKWVESTGGDAANAPRKSHTMLQELRKAIYAWCNTKLGRERVKTCDDLGRVFAKI